MARSPEISQFSMHAPEIRFIGEVRVETQIVDHNPYNNVVVDEVDLHESDHSFVARQLGIGVNKVTVIANYEEGSLGTTYVDEANAVVAAASIADGKEGTWGDKAAISAMGANENAAVRAAQEIINPNRDKIHALAQALHVHKTLFQPDIDMAIASAKKEVKVSIKHPNGQTEVHKGIEPKERVLISGEWVKLKSPITKINPN